MLRGCPFLVPGIILLVILIGCGSSDKQTDTGQMSFNVVDSLLAGRYEMANIGQSFRPPAGFVPASDSMMKLFEAALTEKLGRESNIDLTACFFDSTYSAGVLVAEIDNLTLHSDTTDFFNRYRYSLYEKYGVENIREGEYRVDRVFIKNFLVTDSENVRFQLLGLADSGNVLFYAF